VGGVLVETHYTAVAALYCIAALFLVVGTFIASDSFPWKPRIAYTASMAIVSVPFFMWLYIVSCPVLVISPSGATFKHVGELYEFRVENKSDHDTYMNSFMFYLDSEAYSAKDFDFQVTEDSLKPLGQQLDGVDYGVPDIFGVLGFLPDLENRRLFLLYVYHLAPQESRRVTMKLAKYQMSTNQTVRLSSEVMSHTDKAVPITKDGVVVYVPALIKRPLALTDFLVCYIKQGTHIPCAVRQSTKPPLVVTPQCISLAVVSEKELPKKILAGKCEP
jgi:hypothetical protein